MLNLLIFRAETSLRCQLETAVLVLGGHDPAHLVSLFVLPQQSPHTGGQLAILVTHSPLDNSDDGIDHSSIPSDVLAYKGEQALALARAARSVIYAEEQLVRKRLAEGEILLSILRDEAEEVQLRLREADRQIVAIRESHQSQGIPASSEPLDPQLAIVEAELNRPSPDSSEADFHHSPIPDSLEADPQAELAQWWGEELGI